MMLTSSDLTMSSSAYVTDSEIAPDLTIADLQPQIIQLQDQGFTQQQLVDWMTSQGVQYSRATLQRRLHDWGRRRNAATKITDELAERVNYLFHHSLLSDSQIA